MNSDAWHDWKPLDAGREKCSLHGEYREKKTGDCAYIQPPWGNIVYQRCDRPKDHSFHTCWGNDSKPHIRQTDNDHRYVSPTATLRESLAAIEHEQWMAWSKSLYHTEGNAISSERVQRWATMWVPYDELTEEQKDQDRVWADKVLEVFDKP